MTTPRTEWRAEASRVPEGPERVFARRAPILGLALCALAGSWMGGVLPGSALWTLLGVGGLAAAGLFVRKRTANVPLFLLWTLGFALHAHLSEHPASPDHLLRQVPGDEQLALVGIIDAELVSFPDIDGTSTNTFVPMRVVGLKRGRESVTARGSVQLAFYSETPDLSYGDRLRVEGVLQRRDGPGPLLGRTRHRLRVQGWTRTETRQGNALLALSYRLRQHASRVLGRGLEDAPETSGVLRAMVLGYREELPREWSERFARTGTLHVFAISGLHVGILAAVILLFLRFLGVPRTRVFHLLMPILFLFVLCTGLKASAIRAAIMLGLYWLAPAIRRPTDSRAALALAVIAILAWAPHQVRSIGFLFSFSIVAGIIALYPLLYAPLRRLGLPDPWRLEEDTLRWKTRQIAAGHLGSLAAMSVAAWLVSMPLTAYLFHLFSPGALLGNLFVVPAATGIVWSGLATLVFGSISDSLAVFGNQCSHFVIGGLLWCIQLLDQIPLSHRYVERPPLPLVLVYFAALFSLAVRSLRRRWVPAFLLVLVMGFGSWTLWKARQARVDFLTLDRGQAELLLLPGADVLFDAGPAYRGFVLRQHLKANGVNRLEALVLTHADATHVGGVMELLPLWRPSEVWVPDTPRSSASLNRVLASLAERDIPVRRIAAGDSGSFGGGVDWRCLHPPREFAPIRAEDHSLVIELSRPGGVAVLLCGGLGPAREDAVPNTRSEVLHLPNTTAWDTASPAWLERHPADTILLPANTWERGGNPNHELVERAEATGAETINLYEAGDLRLWLGSGRTKALLPRRRAR